MIRYTCLIKNTTHVCTFNKSELVIYCVVSHHEYYECSLFDHVYDLEGSMKPLVYVLR